MKVSGIKIKKKAMVFSNKKMEMSMRENSNKMSFLEKALSKILKETSTQESGKITRELVLAWKPTMDVVMKENS